MTTDEVRARLVEWGTWANRLRGGLSVSRRVEIVDKAVAELVDIRQHYVIRSRFQRGRSLAALAYHLDLTPRVVERITLHALEQLAVSIQILEENEHVT